MNAILGANSARSGAGGGSFKNFYLSSFTSGASGAPLPKFELLINENVLPSNMSIYQAIKLYSNANAAAATSATTATAAAALANTNRTEDMDNDIESSLLNNVKRKEFILFVVLAFALSVWFSSCPCSAYSGTRHE